MSPFDPIDHTPVAGYVKPNGRSRPYYVERRLPSNRITRSKTALERSRKLKRAHDRAMLFQGPEKEGTFYRGYW